MKLFAVGLVVVLNLAFGSGEVGKYISHRANSVFKSANQPRVGGRPQLPSWRCAPEVIPSCRSASRMWSTWSGRTSRPGIMVRAGRLRAWIPIRLPRWRLITGLASSAILTMWSSRVLASLRLRKFGERKQLCMSFGKFVIIGRFLINSQNIPEKGFNITVRLPTTFVHGKYDLNMNILLLQLTGKGPFNLTLGE